MQSSAALRFVIIYTVVYLCFSIVGVVFIEGGAHSFYADESDIEEDFSNSWLIGDNKTDVGNYTSDDPTGEGPLDALINGVTWFFGLIGNAVAFFINLFTFNVWFIPESFLVLTLLICVPFWGAFLMVIWDYILAIGRILAEAIPF